MKNIILPLLSALIILSFSPLKGQETIKSIKEKGQIVLGTTGTQRPFSYKDENDSLIGIDIEIASALAHGMEVELVVKEMPFETLLPELQAGNLDFVMSGLSMKIDRNMDFAMVGPYHKSDKTILSTKGLKKFTVSALNVKEVKLAAISSSTSEKLIQDFYPNAELISVENAQAGVEKVLSNEANGFVGDYETCAEIIYQSSDLNLSYINDIPIYDPLGIALRADDMLFLNLMENFLNAVEASGYLKYLDKKYYK